MHNYKIVVNLNENFSLKNATVVRLNLTENTPEGVLDALEKSGLTSADLRAKTLFVPQNTNPLGSILMYAALAGFAGRYLDYIQESTIIEASGTHRFFKKLALTVNSPEETTPWLQIGSPYPGVTSIPYGYELGEKEIGEIKNSKKVRLALAGLDSSESLNLLITVCGLRSKERTERMPYVTLDPSLAWDEPDHLDPLKQIPNGFDLESLRKQGAEIRRNKRIDSREAIVGKTDADANMIYLEKAANYPIEEVLVKLKTKQNSETELWHCPRPDRHRNKDANASTKVIDGKVRCFRCDVEPVDSLRLTMDCLQLDPLEAANFILKK